MAFSVFIHHPDSIYDDVPWERYQFPEQYLTRIQQSEGDWIVYYEPKSVKDARGYFAVAKVQEIIPDPGNDKMHLAVIERDTYFEFSDPVPFKDADGWVEQGLINDTGKLSGRARSAVRTLSPSDFARIVTRGLGSKEGILPRTNHDDDNDFQDIPEPFGHFPTRARIEQLTSRAVRDRYFRKNVLRAYGEQCAITGLRLINGHGRVEVEAAHIRPVRHNGPDIVANGIALSGTAHWMFDRGLVGLGSDLTILVSRQVNDYDAVMSIINETGKLITPQLTRDHPRSEFVEWHRTNCFKQ